MEKIKQYTYTTTQKRSNKANNEVAVYRSMIETMVNSMNDEDIMTFFNCYYAEHEGEHFYEIRMESHNEQRIGAKAFLVYDKNGNLIAVASNWVKAVLIYKSRFRKLPKRISDVIKEQIVDQY